MFYKFVYIVYHWLRIVWHNTPVFICQWNKTLLKQAAICKGKLCINQTSKYEGLYIILQNTGVLYLSRTFLRKFCSPGIRFWTFPPKLYLLALILLFTPGLHDYSWELCTLTKLCTNLVENCTTEKSVFFTLCVHKMLIFHFILHLHFLIVRWISVYYFTFFSDKLKFSVFICCIKVTRQN